MLLITQLKILRRKEGVKAVSAGTALANAFGLARMFEISAFEAIGKA
jgi:hypothetical protein